MYTVDQIALEIGCAKHSVYNKISKLGITRSAKDRLINLYTEEQLHKIRCSFTENIKYYPLKTTETFYIYESRLNTM